MPRISGKNQVTIPVSVLAETGLQPGDDVLIDALEDGAVRIRRGTLDLEDAFGALTGVYKAGYLERLDAEDEQR